MPSSNSNKFNKMVGFIKGREKNLGPVQKGMIMKYKERLEHILLAQSKEFQPTPENVDIPSLVTTLEELSPPVSKARNELLTKDLPIIIFDTEKFEHYSPVYYQQILRHDNHGELANVLFVLDEQGKPHFVGFQATKNLEDALAKIVTGEVAEIYVLDDYRLEKSNPQQRTYRKLKKTTDDGKGIMLITDKTLGVTIGHRVN